MSNIKSKSESTKSYIEKNNPKSIKKKKTFANKSNTEINENNKTKSKLNDETK